MRTRTRLTPFPGGGKAIRKLSGDYIVNDLQEPSTLYPAVLAKCVDEVNRRDRDNPLTIEFESRNFVPMNGERGIPESLNYQMYKDWYAGCAYRIISHHPGALSSIPSVGTVATAVLARSNPSKPYVSVPNFLYELKDLPQMIKDIGHLKLQLRNIRRKGVQQVTPKNAASHLLSYQMGWSPLIGDLRKLLDFQAQVDKKMRELDQLYNKGGLQRRVRSPQWKASSSSHDAQETVSSGIGISIWMRKTIITNAERWGTVRWQPRTRPSTKHSNRELAKLARDLTFGMKGISAKQLWDAIPWTWLIGWFSNVDEFLQAHDNTIPLTHSTPCIMTKRETFYDYSRIPGNNEDITGGYGRAIRITKEREMNGGSLSATIPFLSGRQLSILGALAIQRRR